MYTMLIIASLVLILIAGIATWLAFKQEEKKIATYKAQNLTPEEERKRSQEYEENSVSKVVPLQIWTYTITAVVTVVMIVLFMK